MLYQNLTPVDASELKKVTEDHLCQVAALLLHKVTFLLG